MTVLFQLQSSIRATKNSTTEIIFVVFIVTVFKITYSTLYVVIIHEILIINRKMRK